MRPWIVFDGDNTLWQTERLYDDARETLVATLAKAGADPDEARKWQLAHDAELARSMGYSMHRFPRGFRDTAERFLGADRTLHLQAALGIGYQVFAQAAAPAPGVDEALRSLALHWNLALLTAGETTIQEKRVRDFGRSDLFKVVRIVPVKTAETFAALARELGFDPGAAWAVGDSLRSDVVPASAAGYNALLVEARNWTGHEMAGQTLPSRARAVASLPEAARLIGAARAAA